MNQPPHPHVLLCTSCGAQLHPGPRAAPTITCHYCNATIELYDATPAPPPQINIQIQVPATRPMRHAPPTKRGPGAFIPLLTVFIVVGASFSSAIIRSCAAQDQARSIVEQATRSIPTVVVVPAPTHASPPPPPLQRRTR
jgi:hypothetical protein